MDFSEYHNLNFIRDEFVPYNELWQVAFNFTNDKEEWFTQPLLKINYQDTEKKIKDIYLKKTRELIKRFQEREPPEENTLMILESLKKDIDSFREKMWMIELLTTEAMKNLKKSKGHWEEIYKRINEKDEEEDEGVSPVKKRVEEGENEKEKEMENENDKQEEANLLENEKENAAAIQQK